MLVSIVMPSFNQAKYLPQAVESVLTQSWQSLELIVMDGGSTDGSVEILKEYQQQDRRLRYWSEPDLGPANAINKALKKCRGTLIGWLNSDDLYTTGAIGRSVQAMTNNPEWILCYGWGEHINAQGTFIEAYPTLPAKLDNSVDKYHVPERFQFQKGCFICQPTVFFKATMPVLIGYLDESLRASFDFEYWLRAFNGFPERIGFIPEVQAQSRLHDECITQNQRRTVAREGMKVLAKHQGFAAAHWVLSYLDEQKKTGESDKIIQADIKQLMEDVQLYMHRDEWQLLNQSLNTLMKGK